MAITILKAFFWQSFETSFRPRGFEPEEKEEKVGENFEMMTSS
jgi:hypothetical protein